MPYKIPELSGVIELFKVTEFVDDDVVGEMRREAQNAVTEIEIAALGAATPACFLIAHGDVSIGESVVHVHHFYSLRRETQCIKLCFVKGTKICKELLLPRSLLHLLLLLYNPYPFFLYESFSEN